MEPARLAMLGVLHSLVVRNPLLEALKQLVVMHMLEALRPLVALHTPAVQYMRAHR